MTTPLLLGADRRKAREKAEKLVREQPAVKKDEVPEVGIKPLTVELAPGFNRPKVEKAVLEWFWKEQRQVKATRKQITLTLEVKV